LFTHCRKTPTITLLLLPRHPKDLKNNVAAGVGGVLASLSHHLQSSIGVVQLEYFRWPFTAASGSVSTPQIRPSSNFPDLGEHEFFETLQGLILRRILDYAAAAIYEVVGGCIA